MSGTSRRRESTRFFLPDSLKLVRNLPIRLLTSNECEGWDYV